MVIGTIGVLLFEINDEIWKLSCIILVCGYILLWILKSYFKLSVETHELRLWLNDNPSYEEAIRA